MALKFIVYDLIFLALFIIGIIIFISTRKHNVQRQGLLYLYKTQLGVKAIDKTAKKFSKILRPLQYIIVFSGYILMLGILWILIQAVYLYFTEPLILQTIRAPPIAPLIPYFPELFNLESFFPPFYFTYFIIAFLIVAVSHEFSHGIFARLNNIKIHSTGFAFLGPFLGAFVEQDEKQMEKAPKFPQLSILAAGTFANVIMTILFGLILILFFTSFFTPAGVYFTSYSASVINISDADIPDFSLDEEFVPITANNQTYYAYPAVLQKTLDESRQQIIVYDDAPAFQAKLSGAITSINSIPTTSYEALSSAIKSHSPGQEVIIKTIQTSGDNDYLGNQKEFTLKLAEKEGQSFLGIGVNNPEPRGIIGKVYNSIASIKNPLIFYSSSLGSFGWFIYFLLWWIVVINILVALFNMIPVGIFDGGRFFYLTIWGITGKENIGKKAFALSTWLILLLFALLMFRWLFSFF